MNRHDFSPPTRKKEFPTGLVILGALLVLFIWLRMYRPQFLGPLPLTAASSLPTTAQLAIQQPQPSAPATTPLVTRPALRREPAVSAATEASTAPAALDDPEGRKGDFYRYTDEEGIIHLVDNPNTIPASFRHQVKVYRDTTPATRVHIVNNVVLVPVTLRNGQRTVEATLVLDTGCSVTTISERLAARLDIDANETRPGQARVADGSNVPARMALLDRVTAGPRSRGSLEVGIMTNAGPTELADGLLGMDFLRDFRYHVDFARQQIDWH